MWAPLEKHDADARAGDCPSLWAAANVTSFTRHWREIVEQEPKVWCLSETLLHAADSSWVEPALRSYGKRISLGASCLQVGRESWGP